MADEEIAGYLIRRELENGDDEFWNPTEKWVSDPGDSELYEDEDEANAVADLLSENESLVITVEEVYFDDGEEDEATDGE
ncbi:hypothetical protein JRX38_13885 [Gluconobacter cerinus]|uniref:hypothetical protein n=1 Tax=Gluconobacter cerinus TaxID=38307 RepID=UPI00193F5855|nr:hypothetical protein [Gluconobacter cerinus]MBM3099087.1 hypothetical protein [Gluconobacter cerinus]